MLYLFTKRSFKKTIIIIFLAGFITLVYIKCFGSYGFAITDKYTALNLASGSKTKFVLSWTPFGKTWDYRLGFGFKPFKNCKYDNCFITTNRSLLSLDQFDALIFHATYDKQKHGIPWIRLPHQRYIFNNMEAPVHICPDLKQYSSYFNWTMTYRFDSDVVKRHGYLFSQKTNYIKPSAAFLKGKTRLAAWMVSNCRTPSHREDLIKEIQKFTAVDVYGACGTLQCARKKTNSKISSSECYDIIEKNYKFYFSFENSFCKDYSTEKLYNILLKDVVPVVYGFGDYKLSAPPYSVINVKDFNSAEDLVNYLKFLDENVDEYLKYFEWKKHFWLTRSTETSACQMCKKLHEPIKQSIYHDLHSWWGRKDNSICRTEKLLPKIVSDLL